MPKYQYECPGDSTVIEIERGIHEPEESYRCGTCGAMLLRVYHSPGVIFKGNGFYHNDKSK